jgi:ribosomal protein S27AE
MSKHLFNLSCPRCDTVVRIQHKKTDYQCSRCHFKIFINDSHNLLESYSNGKIKDLEVIENSVNEFVDGTRKEGLSLSFQEMTSEQAQEEEQAEPTFGVGEDIDGKSSHTQVINLSFDPTKVLDEYTAKKNASKKKMSLNQAIENAKHARTEVSNFNRYLLIGGIVLAFVIILIIFILGAK